MSFTLFTGYTIRSSIWYTKVRIVESDKMSNSLMRVHKAFVLGVRGMSSGMKSKCRHGRWLGGELV